MIFAGRLALFTRSNRPYAVWGSALFGAGAGAVWMRPDFYEPAAAEIITLVAVLMAGILPTAILSATILRAGGLSVRRIVEVRNALLRQMDIWAGLFAISAVAGMALATGKLLKWSMVVHSPRVSIPDMSLMPILNGIVTGSLVLLTLRMMTIFTGLRSLIVLSAEIAQSEAAHRDRSTFQAGIDAIEAMEPRKNFGKQIDLLH